MIKVKSFENHIADDLDVEIEAYIKENHIIREDIIDTKFYSAKGEDGYLYHYGKLVYDFEEFRNNSNEDIIADNLSEINNRLGSFLRSKGIE